MKTRLKIKDVALISLGVIIVVLSCMLFVVFVVFIAVKQPIAFMGALICGVCFFVVLGDLIEMLYKLYKERNEKEKDEKVTIKI
ncbi:hypothetical protein [Tannerella forsythia]